MFNYSKQVGRPTSQKLPNLDRSAQAIHNIHRTLPAPKPHPPTLRRICHLRSADLQPQDLIKRQFRDWLCIRTRTVRPQIMSGQSLVQGLPQTPLPEQPDAVHSVPAVVNALGRLPVQLLAGLTDRKFKPPYMRKW